jgi:hypothetical protein
MNIKVFSFVICLASVLKTVGQTFNGNVSFLDRNFENFTVYGLASLKRVEAKDIRVFGKLKFQNIRSTDISVTGCLEGEEGNFINVHIVGYIQTTSLKTNTLEITGPAKLYSAIIHEKAKISGDLRAKGSKILDLIVFGENIHLEDTVVKNILVKIHPEGKQQTVTLKYANIENNIIFESGNGIVRALSSKDYKIGGNISGGYLNLMYKDKK